MALVGPPPMLEQQPVHGDARRPPRASARPRPLPAGRDELLARRAHAASPTNRSRCCSSTTSATDPCSRCGCSTANVVFMLGPEANHYILVSHASNFTWRDGHFRDLIGLMGDGLLDDRRRLPPPLALIMLPAFHRDHIAASRRGDRRGDRTGARDDRAGHADRPVRVDATAGHARGHARAVRRRPRRRGAPARSTRPACSRRRSPSTPPTTCCACFAAAARRGGGCSRPRASSTR